MELNVRIEGRQATVTFPGEPGDVANWVPLGCDGATRYQFGKDENGGMVSMLIVDISRWTLQDVFEALRGVSPSVKPVSVAPALFPGVEEPLAEDEMTPPA